MTFFFDVCVDIFCGPMLGATTIRGVAIFNKKVILYGSEGNVKVFSSDGNTDDLDAQSWSCRAMPKATVQIAEPVGLTAQICECPPHPCDGCCRIPDCICKRYGNDFQVDGVQRAVYVTIGLFTIVQIVRNVQLLIPAYDFCIPEKECVATSDDPCELFRRIEFPTDEFSPEGRDAAAKAEITVRPGRKRNVQRENSRQMAFQGRRFRTPALNRFFRCASCALRKSEQAA